MKLQPCRAYGAKFIRWPLTLCRFTQKHHRTQSVLDCGDKSPLSTARHVASFHSADVSAHSQMLIRTAIVTVPLAIVAVCLFGYFLHSQSGIFREFQAALLSLQWILLVCLAVWCGSFIFLTFNLNDLPLIGLLLIAIAAYFINYGASWRGMDAVILLAGVTLGRGATLLLRERSASCPNSQHAASPCDETIIKRPRHSTRCGLGQTALQSYFLIGVVLLLTFSSWWHLDMSDNFYHGPRWMGLWNNPNIYGMLMGAGSQ